MKKSNYKWVDGKLRPMAQFLYLTRTLHVYEGYEDRIPFFKRELHDFGYDDYFIEMNGTREKYEFKEEDVL